jgi:hypothetical protein
MIHHSYGMVKTQIQVPEKQYKALRDFAAAREWSMAETFRRGAELLLELYPQGSEGPCSEWSPPSSATVGWKGLDAAALKEAALQDGEPVLGPNL